MTTIAYNAQEGVMVSDTLVSDEGYYSKSYCTKIFRIKQDLVGAAKGNFEGQVFLDWYVGKLEDQFVYDLDNSEEEPFEALVVKPNKEVLLYNSYLCPIKLGKIPFYAIGSGSKIAMAVMDAGMSCEKAVEMACKYDLYSGGDLTALKL